MSDDRELVERLRVALETYDNFVRGREAMNAVRPAIDATRAERELYDERYQADHENEREHFRTALGLFVNGDIRLAADRIEAIGNTRIVGDAETFVPGNVWRDDDEECWTTEVQIIGGYEVAATIHAESEEAATELRDLAITAWNTRITPGSDLIRDALVVLADEMEGLLPYLANHNWRVDKLYEAVCNARAALTKDDHGGGQTEEDRANPASQDRAGALRAEPLRVSGKAAHRISQGGSNDAE